MEPKSKHDKAWVDIVVAKMGNVLNGEIEREI